MVNTKSISCVRDRKKNTWTPVLKENKAVEQTLVRELMEIHPLLCDPNKPQCKEDKDSMWEIEGKDKLMPENYGTLEEHPESRIATVQWEEGLDEPQVGDGKEPPDHGNCRVEATIICSCKQPRNPKFPACLRRVCVWMWIFPNPKEENGNPRITADCWHQTKVDCQQLSSMPDLPPNQKP